MPLQSDLKVTRLVFRVMSRVSAFWLDVSFDHDQKMSSKARVK